jgi:hypothetical protein
MTKRLTFEQLLEGPTPVTIINEPIVDFVVGFTVEEEPKAESATARALRRWFKQKDVDYGQDEPEERQSR